MGFALTVRFTAKDAEAAARFDALVAETIKGIEGEEGTLLYINHALPDEPNVRVIYELYADRAAYEAHEKQPHVQHLLAEGPQYLVAHEVTFLSDPAGKGAPAH